MIDPPWDDCKVAFGIHHYTEDKVWNLWEYKQPPLGWELPQGWELNETDGSGCRNVVIFRVNGFLINEDAKKVRQLLNRLDRNSRRKELRERKKRNHGK